MFYHKQKTRIFESGCNMERSGDVKAEGGKIAEDRDFIATWMVARGPATSTISASIPLYIAWFCGLQKPNGDERKNLHPGWIPVRTGTDSLLSFGYLGSCIALSQ
jgi:hypothetical protein